ncbi:MAG: recombinase family protein [Synechococcaceae cyanobacterium]|nr:recombinase family protein [Synechococcaceae cyanobacterium]
MGQVAGYIRVSSSRQADEGDSPQNQQARLEQAGATRFFADPGVSGFKLEKRRSVAGLEALKAAIRAGEVSRLLCTRLDRIGRRDEIVLELADLCEQQGVEFLSLASGAVDTTSASGWLSVKVQLLLGEHYSRALSESIAGGYRGAWARGVPARGPLPFHLQRAEGTEARQHQFVPSPAWGDARRAVELLLAGGTTSEVAALLREAGHIRSRSGVLYWLRSPVLAGHAADYRQRRIRLPNAAPALVSQAEFDAIQERLAANRKRWGANAASRGSRAPTITPLSGLCRCSLCGHMLCQHRRGSRRNAAGVLTPGPWALRCVTDGCPACSWVQSAIETALGALLRERVDEAVEHVMRPWHQRQRKPSAEELKLRQELQLRLKLPEELRQPSDRERILELRSLIAALETARPPGGKVGPFTLESVERVERELLLRSMRGDPSDPEEDSLGDDARRKRWVQLIEPGGVLVDLPAKRVVSVSWQF